MPDNAAEPIVERIALRIADTLSGVKTPGYRVSLRQIFRPSGSALPNGMDHLDVILWQLDDDANDAVENSQTQGWRQPFVVFVNILQSELNETPFDTMANRVRADIHKALLADRQCNGLALNTLLHRTEILPDVMGLEGVCVNFTVQYETDEANPYSL